MFARGEIPDPGYSKVKALADYFMRVGVVPVPATDEAPPQAVAWDGRTERRQMG
jgi:hypothetical protein